jgi:metallo-beta-lactamase family protein
MDLNLSLAFHGAARTTTGSRHLLTLDGRNILLDCGLFQGRRKDTESRNREFQFSPNSIHNVILSHAHIDHSGNLPNLVRQGCNSSIYCTPATEDLCRLMLIDSAYIQERDAEYLNRRFAKRKLEKRIEPLYSAEDAEKTISQFKAVHYHRPHHILRDLTLTFIDAGHILGSAAVILDIQRSDRKFRLVFSGDIGRSPRPILRAPEIPAQADWLIIEGTYGIRSHDDIANARKELRDTVKRVAKRGGKIIIPSFSVERTQEIVYYLNGLHNEGAIPPMPVYVDSPLATNVTEVFRIHRECYDEETRKLLEYDNDPFGFNNLIYTRSVEESKALNNLRVPAIIISASGMCEFGRVVHHLRNTITDSKNCVLIVGYQAEHTLGRRLVERRPKVRIFGKTLPLRAEVVTLNAMSGHADREDLVNYAGTVREHSPNLKKIFLVHGEEDALLGLGETLRKELKLDVVVPELNQKFDLEDN